MKKFIAIALLLVLALSAVVLPLQAQTAPQGIFYGTWPYVLPPDHNLNAFASNGIGDNLGTLFESYVFLPGAIYNWGTQQYVGLLADSWGFSSDNTYYSITYRSDARWSNGEPVTSEDVVDTFALGRLNRWSDFNYISSVTAIDDHTVHFTFSGEPSLPAERLLLKDYIVDRFTYGDLAQRALAMFATGATSTDTAWTDLSTELANFRPTDLIASGPYTYALSDVGDAFMTMHWQPNSIFSNSVKFGEVRLWAGDTEPTTPLLLAGQIAHSTDVYPASTIQQVQAMSGMRLLNIPRGYGPALLFNHDVAPWGIKEVRQAVAYVIDRSQNAFLTNGIGATATVYMSGLLDDNVPQLLNPDVIAQLNHYDHNLDQAATLMTQAGFTRNSDGKWADSSGAVVTAEYQFPGDFADFSGAAQDAIAQLNAFGFNITARSLPSAQAAANIRSGDFQLSVWSWANQSPFASRQFFGPTQRFNYVGLSNGQPGMNFPMQFEWNGQQVDLNDMISHASDGLDPAVQRDRAGQVALIINDMLPFIPLNVERSIEPLNENLVVGMPPDSDSWLQNPTGSDHALIYYFLTGVLSPGPGAMTAQ